MRQRRRQVGGERSGGDSALGLRAQVLELHLAAGPIVGADDDRERRLPGVRQLELLSHSVGAKCVLDSHAGLAELMRDVQHVRQILLGDAGDE